jgi:hypothetical protein
MARKPAYNAPCYHRKPGLLLMAHVLVCIRALLFLAIMSEDQSLIILWVTTEGRRHGRFVVIALPGWRPYMSIWRGLLAVIEGIASFGLGFLSSLRCAPTSWWSTGVGLLLLLRLGLRLLVAGGEIPTIPRARLLPGCQDTGTHRGKNSVIPRWSVPGEPSQPSLHL